MTKRNQRLTAVLSSIRTGPLDAPEHPDHDATQSAHVLPETDPVECPPILTRSPNPDSCPGVPFPEFVRAGFPSRTAGGWGVYTLTDGNPFSKNTVQKFLVIDY